MIPLSPEKIKIQFRSLGFQECHVAQVDASPHFDSFSNWVNEGQHGDMAWLEKNLERRQDPREFMPECQSLIMTGTNYYQTAPTQRGKIATYALGLDYHELIADRLRQLCLWLNMEYGGTHRPFVDTSAVLEKPWAMRSGLGWQGKNTLIIHKKFGTWLSLGGIFTSLNLKPDLPEKDHCGSCTRCIDICPTQAITAPYQLDARRCIAYLTIEHKGSIPIEFRRAIGDKLFGCDDCLTVCPWNRWAQETHEAHFKPVLKPDLAEMLAWDDPMFREKTRGTPIFRLKRPRWIRNICVVLGNVGNLDDLPALHGAAQECDPLIQEHARWAITEIERRNLC